MEGEPTRIMIGVNESTIKGYPHASISSRGAFDWTLKKIVRSNTSEFNILFLHVQIPDEDGFDDMDSIFASPDDFRRMNHRDEIRGLHLLEYFVNRCHEVGVLVKHGSRKVIQRKLCVMKLDVSNQIFLLLEVEDLVHSRGMSVF